MTNPEKFYRVKIGDKILSKFGSTKGMTGTVIKIHKKPPSITAGFKDSPLLSGFIIGKYGLVEFRLEAKEFEVLDKTTYSHPSKNMN